MISKFSLSVQEILYGAKCEEEMLNHPYIGTEHLFLSILKNNNLSLCKILNKFNIYYDNYKNELLKLFPKYKIKNSLSVYTPLLKKIITTSICDSNENGESIIYPNVLFNNLLSFSDGSTGIKIIINMGTDYNRLLRYFRNNIYKNNNKLNYLNLYGINMNKTKYDPVYYRDKIINNVFEILCRKDKNNPLLIGKAGTGKTAIVEEISRRINLGKCPYKLLNYTVINIPISSIVAGTKYRGEFEEKINRILKEASNNKVILFMDEVHTIINAGSSEGGLDAANILKPFLARGSIKIIGATTINEYNKSIRKDAALDRRFQKVNVDELGFNATLSILYKLKDSYSKYHDIIIPNSSLKYIVSSSIKFFPNLVNPDKSIDILDLSAVKTSLKINSYVKQINYYKNFLYDVNKLIDESIKSSNFKLANLYKSKEIIIKNKLNELYKLNKSHKNTLTVSTINEVIKEKSGAYTSKYSYDKFYKYLSSNIVSNLSTIKSLCSYFNIIINNKRERPYSILFTGSHGTGKSYIPYIISKFFHLNYIFVNSYSSLDKLISDVLVMPNSVILFDEIESFGKSINIINNIIKEGFIEKDGTKVYFNNTIIFMSSNLNVSSGIGFDDSINNKNLYDFFGEYFINNIDKIYMLDSFDYDNICKLIKKKLSDNNFSCNQNNINYVFDKCMFEKYGASRIDKVIKNDLLLHKIDTNKSVI